MSTRTDNLRRAADRAQDALAPIIGRPMTWKRTPHGIRLTITFTRGMETRDAKAAMHLLCARIELARLEHQFIVNAPEVDGISDLVGTVYLESATSESGELDRMVRFVEGTFEALIAWKAAA